MIQIGKYQVKVTPFEAIQLTKEPGDGLAIATWCGPGKAICHIDPWTHEPLVVVFNEYRGQRENHLVHPGDWVLKSVDGDFVGMSDALFQSLYVKCDDHV